MSSIFTHFSERVIQCAESCRRVLCSTVGKAVLLVIGESVGASLGSAVSAPVAREVGAFSGRTLVPMGVAAWALHQTRCVGTLSKIQKAALPILAICLTVDRFSMEATFLEEPFAIVAEQVGLFAGIVLGGFAVRKALLQNTSWQSYFSGMFRYHSAGLVFDAAITVPSSPAALCVLYIPREIGKIACQTLAYDAPTTSAFLRKEFANRTFESKLIAPLIFRALSKRFGSKKEATLGAQMLESSLNSFIERQKSPTHLALSYVPFPIRYPLQKLWELTPIEVGSICPFIQPLTSNFLPSLKQYLKDSMIRQLTPLSSEIPEIFLESLYRYILILHDTLSIDLSIPPQQNVGIFQNKIQKYIKIPRGLSWFLQLETDQTFARWSGSIHESLKAFESKLIGGRLTEKLDLHLAALIPVCLRYYLYYLLTQQNALKDKFSIKEEIQLFHVLNGSLFSALRLSENPEAVLYPLHKLIDLAIGAYTSFYKSHDQDQLAVSLTAHNVRLDEHFFDMTSSESDPPPSEEEDDWVDVPNPPPRTPAHRPPIEIELKSLY